MKLIQLRFNYYSIIAIIATCVMLYSCKTKNERYSVVESEIGSLRNQIDELNAGSQSITKNLITFDTLDFSIFSHQQWWRFKESHSKDIIVNWPDGHHTIGLEKHIEDLKAMFVYAPNTSIKTHPIRFGSGNTTCVTGVMTGTFTAPMPLGFGKFIKPTGKLFSIPMCTIGIWKDGVMIEETLFWDNKTYMEQLGINE